MSWSELDCSALSGALGTTHCSRTALSKCTSSRSCFQHFLLLLLAFLRF